MNYRGQSWASAVCVLSAILPEGTYQFKAARVIGSFSHLNAGMLCGYA